MAEKTIPDLSAIENINEFANTVIDTGSQTFKMSSINLARNLNKYLKQSFLVVDDDFTVLSSHSGFTLLVDSNAKEIEITLPDLSTVPNGFNVTIKDHGGVSSLNNISIVLSESTDSMDGKVNGSDLIRRNYQAVKYNKNDSEYVRYTYFPSTDFFINATGGTITEDGSFKVHTFLDSDYFEILSGSGDVQYLMIGGGGGGGRDIGGGGGAGGYLAGTFTNMQPGSYPVVIGAGGVGAVSTTPNGDGEDTEFNSLTSFGGGAGGNAGAGSQIGKDGGSGGGAGNSGNPFDGGSGTVGQGNDGGTNGGVGSTSFACGGGGGANAVGSNASAGQGGAGGSGISSDITGTSVTRAGGGGGGVATGTPGAGGAGGGGAGNVGSSGNGVNGTANTGGGGGGAATNSGGNGGKGILILRYQFKQEDEE